MGLWKNIEDLESSICLDELQALLTAAHDREYRHNKFAAALKGINLDEEGKADAKERFDAIKRRVDGKAQGKSEAEIEMDIFGLDVEVE